MNWVDEGGKSIMGYRETPEVPKVPTANQRASEAILAALANGKARQKSEVVAPLIEAGHNPHTINRAAGELTSKGLMTSTPTGKGGVRGALWQIRKEDD